MAWVYLINPIFLDQDKSAEACGRDLGVPVTCLLQPCLSFFHSPSVRSLLSLGDGWATVAAALRQVPRSSGGPSPATSTPRYVRPLVFPSRCTKSSTQTLTYYLCSDLI